TYGDGDPQARADRPNHADTCPFHVDRDFKPPRHDRSFNLRPAHRRHTAYIDALPAIPSRLADPNRISPHSARARPGRPSTPAVGLWPRSAAAAINVLRALQDQPSPYHRKEQLAASHNAGMNWRGTRNWRFSALSPIGAGGYNDT